MGTEVTFYDLPMVEVELPGQLHMGIPGENGATFTPEVNGDGILSWENDKGLENPDSVDLKALLQDVAQQELAQIRQDIEDLKYREIRILSLTASVQVAELGSVVDQINLFWETNKTPAYMTLDAVDMKPTSGTTEFGWFSANAGLTADKTWIVKAVDERGAEDNASVSLKFLNGIYYGVLEGNTEITSEVILELNKKLQGGRAVDFSVREKRPVYACPTRYGNPTFKIGGFEYEWEKIATFDFTNASGYTESYDVWMHGQDAAGTMTISVM